MISHYSPVIPHEELAEQFYAAFISFYALSAHNFIDMKTKGCQQSCVHDSFEA